MILAGKAAVITGGSRGIGLAVAEAFKKEGAEVFTIARSGADFSADVSDYSQLEKVISKIGKKKGRIDILVNAAGVHGAIGFLPETDPEDWAAAVKTNLLGTYHAIKAAFPFLKSASRGKIINFSGGGAASPRPFFSAYGAAKAAVVRLTEIGSQEFAEKKLSIDVNAVAPGAIKTRLLKEAREAGEKIGNFEESPAKAVELCLFLASSVSDGISGRLISAVHDHWKKMPQHLQEIKESDIYTLRRIKPEDRGYEW